MLTTQAEKAMMLPSPCERLLLTPLILALTLVKSDKSIFLLSLLDSQVKNIHTVTAMEDQLLQKPLYLDQILDGKPLSHSLFLFSLTLQARPHWISLPNSLYHSPDRDNSR